MREYWGSGLKGGGGGGGGGGGSFISVLAADNFAAGNLVAYNDAGEAILADPSLALSPYKFEVIGVALAAAAAGAFVVVYNIVGSDVGILMDAVPAATANTKPIYLVALGEASLTPPGAGNAVVRVGVLSGADGATGIPTAIFHPQPVAFLP